MPKQSKYYAVVKGKKPGIYNTWGECSSQVTGYSGAIFQSFKSRDDAVQYYQMQVPPAPRPPKRQPPPVTTAVVAAAAAAAVAAVMAPHSYTYGFHPVDPPTITMNYKILSIRIMFDGGSRGNPGPIAGAGAVVTIDTTTTNSNTTSSGDNTTTTSTYRVRQFLGDNHQSITNNQAEYSGCQIGLRVALFHMQREQRLARRQCQPPIKGGSQNTTSDGDLGWVDSILIQGDSQLIINQLNQSYQCKNAQLMVYYEKCQSYLQELVSLSSPPNNEEETNVLIEHVYRDQNKEADGNDLSFSKFRSTGIYSQIIFIFFSCFIPINQYNL